MSSGGNFTIVTFPICMPGELFIWKFFVFIPFIHIAVIAIGFLYPWYDNKGYVIAFTIYSQFVGLISYGIHCILKIERPYPECIPFKYFYTIYGFPAPEIVFTTTTATSIFIYAILLKGRLYKTQMLKHQYYKKEDDGFKISEPIEHRMIITIAKFAARAILVCAALFYMIVYPWLCYMYRLTTLEQSVGTAGVSILLTFFFCFVTINLLKTKHKNNGNIVL